MDIRVVKGQETHRCLDTFPCHLFDNTHGQPSPSLGPNPNLKTRIGGRENTMRTDAREDTPQRQCKLFLKGPTKIQGRAGFDDEDEPLRHSKAVTMSL